MDKYRLMDYALKALYDNQEDGSIAVGVAIKDNYDLLLDGKTLDRIRQELEDEKYIYNVNAGIYVGDDFMASITMKGMLFVEAGGYEKKATDLRIKAEKEADKFKWDSGVSRWQYRTKWMPHIIAVVSTLIAIAALILSIWL